MQMMPDVQRFKANLRPDGWFAKVQAAGGGAWFAIAVTCGCVAVMVLSSGCFLAFLPIHHNKTVIVARAKSPDGAASAELVNEYGNSTVTAPYAVYLIVAPSSENSEKAAKEKNWPNRLVLYVSAPVQIRFSWQDNATLVVSCIDCKLRAQQVTTKLNAAGPVRIIYRGFPQ